MKQCKCPNCGAPINTARMICEYCGTTFKEETGGPPYKPEIRYVVARPGVKTLGIKRIVSEMQARHLGDDFIEAQVRRGFADQIAEAIAKEIVLERDFDLMNMNRVYYARLRVLDPAFRF